MLAAQIVLSYDLVRYFIHIWIGVAYGKGIKLTKKIIPNVQKEVEGMGR